MPLGQKEKTAAGGLLFLAGIAGLEPAKRESKSRVLPLHHIPIRYYYMPYIGFCQYIMFRRGCQYKDLPGAAGSCFANALRCRGRSTVPLRRSVGQPFLPRGGAGCSFRHLDFRTRDPAASPAACGQADDALFSRVAAFFSRRAAPLPIHAFLQLRRRIYIDKKRLLRYNIRYKTVPWR